MLLVLPVLCSGCLPLLLGNARVLHPGELALSVAGMGRTESLPAGVDQAGPAAAVAEVRGGLPGDIVDTGLTVYAPWTFGWDLKCQILHGGTWTPDVAVRADLGILQPSFGGALLVSRSAGPVTLTLMGGRDRRTERLWRSGKGANSLESENYVKDVVAWGVGLECAVGASDDLFAGVVCWDPTTRSESPKTGQPFGADEGRTWAVTAGLRIRWKVVRPAAPRAALTALRGYVLTEPTPDGFEVGQPGIYRAVVLLDEYTKITSDGKPVPRGDLKQGRAVVIQGIALPKPSTFLARTIELQ
ncbi:MAG: hypothetical protein AAB152_18435 [Candidatus Coatesbacteria bacterium]